MKLYNILHQIKGTNIEQSSLDYKILNASDHEWLMILTRGGFKILFYSIGALFSCVWKWNLPLSTVSQVYQDYRLVFQLTTFIKQMSFHNFKILTINLIFNNMDISSSESLTGICGMNEWMDET